MWCPKPRKRNSSRNLSDSRHLRFLEGHLADSIQVGQTLTFLFRCVSLLSRKREDRGGEERIGEERKVRVKICG